MKATALKTEIATAKSYRTFLREILVEKQKKNPRFSLRAFAQQLGIQPSFLSLVLNGKRDFSEETVGLIAEKLSLEPNQAREFSLLVRLEKVKNTNQRDQLLQDLKVLRPDLAQIRDLNIDQFKTIADWYHLPLQILIDLEGFAWSDENAAQALGISVHEVKLALERLSALELIEWNPGTRPRAVGGSRMVHAPEHNQALKIYHETMLKKNIEALYEQDPDQRLTATLSVALNEEQLQEARAILLSAQKKILKLCQTRSAKKEIYHVGLNLFQITRPFKPRS
jgi:uncharacterized protein (TIGR02147 family)